MIDSGSFPAALRRGYYYQFVPAGYDTTYETDDGVITYGEVTPGIYVNSTPLTISSTGSFTITMYSDPGFKVGWIIKLYPGVTPYDIYMLARITTYTVDEITGEVSMTFECYQSGGSGTYSGWSIYAQWEHASNYIQNPQYSAKELSSRVYSPLTAQFNWPYGETSDTVVTSDTDFYKAGYTDITYNAQTQVYEDEYDYNRPYVGVTVTSSRILTTTISTTTWNYAVYPPEEQVVIETTTETLTNSHTFTEDDFQTTGTGYSPGSPAVYLDGNIVSYPSPSVYTHEVTLGSTYRYSEYQHSFEEYLPGEFRPILFVDKTTSLGGATASPISPPGFFYPA